jgi:hypothetical protein
LRSIRRRTVPQSREFRPDLRRHVENSGDALRIDRTRSYVEDEAVVWVSPPDREDPWYSVTVDLANRTVTDITDWNDR